MRSADRPVFTAQTKRLFLGQAAVQLGDGLVQVGFAQLIVFEISRGSTPAAIAQVLAATLLPYSVVGPVAGIVIDRFDRRKVLGKSAMARAVAAVSGIGAWIIGSAPVALGLVLVVTSIGRFLLAAKSAVLPRALGLVGDDSHTTEEPGRFRPGDAEFTESVLAKANAFSSALGVVSVFAGAVAGTAVVAIATPLAFAFGSAAYLVGSLLFFTLHSMPPPNVSTDGGKAVISSALEGLREELRRTSKSDVGMPLGALAWHRSCLGAVIVVVVLIADSRYGLRLPGYTGALVIAGAATLAGSALAPAILAGWKFRSVVASSFITAAIATALSAYGIGIITLVLVVSASSLAFQVLKVGVDSVLQQRAPDLVRGRVFSLQDAAYNASFVLGAALVVPLWARLSPEVLLLVISAAFGAGALFFASARSRRYTRGIALAALSSAVAALAFPVPSLWPLALFCVAPAVYFVSTAESYRRAAVIGWISGAAYFLSTHYWLAQKTLFFQPVIAALFGLTWIPWSLAARATLGKRHLVRGILVVPSVWVLAEYLRSWEFLGGPWALFGASQWNVPWGLEVASWGGVWLVTWIVVLSNASLASSVLALKRVEKPEGSYRPRTSYAMVFAPPVAVAAMLAAVWMLYDGRQIPQHRLTMRIAGVQPGVIDPADERFSAGEAITERLGQGSDLVVWGESSLGEDPFLSPDYMSRLVSLAKSVQAPLLANVDARTETGSIYKTALLVAPEGPTSRYDKQRLVPFGEYVPLRPVFGWVTEFTDAAEEDRGRGSTESILEVRGTDISIAPLICFESAFPDMTRAVVRKGADVVVIQSANTTFQHSWLPQQHASLAALRAAESGRPVVHATLSGVSAAFDGDGRRLAWVNTGYVGSWSVELPVFRRDTLYLRFGDWAVLASAMITAIVGAEALYRYRRSRLAPERLSDESG